LLYKYPIDYLLIGSHPPGQQEWKLQSLRDEMWPEPTTAHKKLCGPVGELKRTTTFITRAALQV
jgi:hypothetical protein